MENIEKNRDDSGICFRQALIDMILESWRFMNVFRNAMMKLSLEEQERYKGRYSWFHRMLNEIAETAGLRIIKINQGETYDIGMAVTALNIEDFQSDDTLIIEQMIEPIIMEKDSVIRRGSVMLERKGK